MENSEVKEFRLINKLALTWRAVGLQLGVEEEILKAIRMHTQDPREAAADMISHWLGRDPKATWNKLIRALRVKIELSTAAKKFKFALLHKTDLDVDMAHHNNHGEFRVCVCIVHLNLYSCVMLILIYHIIIIIILRCRYRIIFF